MTKIIYLYDRNHIFLILFDLFLPMVKLLHRLRRPFFSTMYAGTNKESHSFGALNKTEWKYAIQILEIINCRSLV